jgi:hypothetical protein
MRGLKELASITLIAGATVGCGKAPVLSNEALSPNQVGPIVNPYKIVNTECRGDVPLHRIRWEIWNVGNKGHQNNKPAPVETMPLTEQEEALLLARFDGFTCDHSNISSPDIQRDTVAPCDNEEITIEELNKRLANIANSTYRLESLRKGLAAYRAKACPQKLVTSHQPTPTPTRIPRKSS